MGGLRECPDGKPEASNPEIPSALHPSLPKFRCPGRCSSRGAPPGLRLKGIGAYVILPKRRHTWQRDSSYFARFAWLVWRFRLPPQHQRAHSGWIPARHCFSLFFQGMYLGVAQGSLCEWDSIVLCVVLRVWASL